MSAATLDQLWHRIQEIPFGELLVTELERDEEISKYLTEKVETWLTLTRQWREALGLPTESYFTLAQDLVGNDDSLRLPEAISEWLRGWYRNPPMAWQKPHHPLALIEGSLLWKFAEEKNILKGHKTDNPYEPIIDFLELGGIIDFQDGMFVKFYPGPSVTLYSGMTRIRESVYNTVAREYWESLSKNQKKNKNRSMRNLK